jgi:hypothetical protein
MTIADDVQPAALRGLTHHFLIVRDDVRGAGEEARVFPRFEVGPYQISTFAVLG